MNPFILYDLLLPLSGRGKFHFFISQMGASPLFFFELERAGSYLFRGDDRQIKGSGGFLIGEREGAWLVWVGGGTRRKGGRPAEFTSEIANMNTNEIFNCV
jgi:hypothetical protein